MVSVDTLDHSFYETPVTYNLRWKAVDTTSIHENGLVYDYFDITIQYSCKYDTVALTNSGAGQSLYVYTLGTEQNFAKTTTHTQSCPFTMVCEYYNNQTAMWTSYPDAPIKYCDVSNGITF